MAPEWLAQLQQPKEISLTRCPKIQKVAQHLRDRKHFAKYYLPRLVSFGPIHHYESHHHLGEQYKHIWASMYLRGLEAARLYQKIEASIKDLKVLYSEDAIQRFNDKELARMLFVDGCALLQILNNFDLLEPEKLQVKVDQLVLVNQDVLLLENQLPFQVLKLLSEGDGDDAKIITAITKFLSCHHFAENKRKGATNDTGGRNSKNQIEVPLSPPPPSPPHLLDQLRRNILRDFCPQQNQINNGRTTYRNIKELKAAGIRVQRKESSCPINITFSSGLLSGELRIPQIEVDDTTAPTLLNLMAYEMCPDFENKYEISSYVEFLDSLIDHPDDVKELRATEVLHNSLGSDEEVARLFNTISADLVPDIKTYASVRAELEKHYRNACKTSLAQARSTYFNTPWAIIAFIAACLALILTFLQTWFTIASS